MGKIILGVVVALVVGMVVTYGVMVHRMMQEPISIEDSIPPLPASPRDATFRIDGEEVTFTDGRYERSSAADGASRDVYAFWGEPVFTDVNADGSEDMIVWLTYTGGGSGTFVYVAVAVWDGVGYRGSNAVPLGDRVAPQGAELWHELVRVRLADRLEGQALVEQPTRDVTRYFVVHGAELIEMGPASEGRDVFTGTLVWERDVQTFTPCGEDRSYVLATSSRAYRVLEAIYPVRVAGSAPESPVFMVLEGSVVGADEDDTEGGPDVETLVVQTVYSVPVYGGCVVEEDADRAHSTSTTEVGTTSETAIEPLAL